MITENLSTLRIHKLTQEQYNREVENGTIETNAIYITPEESIEVGDIAYIDIEDNQDISDNAEFNAYITSAINNAKTEVKSEIIAQTITQSTGNNTNKVMSQKAVTELVSNSLAPITTLPYGGSKEWLQNNGDKTKLYQIDGYVWGYLEADGWTKSGTQFLVVSNENEMTNIGGTEYLLRNGDEGTVYEYTESSGDIDIPVYDSFPTTGNDGDIIAVGDRKYIASLSEVDVEHNAYDPDTAQFNYRISGTGGDLRGLGGSLLLDYAEVEYNANCVVTIKGIEKLVKNYDNYVVVDFYDADKNRIGYINGGLFYQITSEGTAIPNGYSGDLSLPLQFRLFAYNSGLDASNTKYIRIKLGIKADNNNISATDCEGLVVNFSTKNTTETKTTWTDIGVYNPPVEASWSATEETHNIIDSLSTSAINGDSAVYSVDGFVYTYIAGSDWVQMSKYNGLAVDSALSNTSTNAIQNKTVASALNELYAIINANTFKTDLIGVMGENNVIYLTDNALPSGTYILKYDDDSYDTIGTITVV